MDTLYKDIALLGEKYHANKIVLFGSRARGDHKERSDIDLAIYGISEKEHSSFWSDIEALPTLLAFDLVYITPDTNPELIQNIEKDGVVLYEKS